MEKTLISVVKKMDGKVEFVSLPITDHPELVDRYKIASNPTTILSCCMVLVNHKLFDPCIPHLPCYKYSNLWLA